MATDTNFQVGDSLWSLARKILLRLNQSTLAAATQATQPTQGDMLFNLKRKTLLRLNQMFPTATGDVIFRQGDSLWSIERKILAVLNQAS